MIPPILRRHMFEPLYLLKSRSPRLGYWQTLEKTQYYSRQQLEDIQWQRLQQLWMFLWNHNAFYRKRFIDSGLNEKSLQTPEDIKKLPTLSKKEIRTHTDVMLSQGFKEESLLHFKTGGSTGKALDIFMTEECSEMRNACARRHDRWSGWQPGEPIGAVWGNPKLPVSMKDRIVNSLVQPVIYLDTMAVSDSAVIQFAEEWEKKSPTLIFGHAHSVYLLAKFIDKLAINNIRPKGIISTSMMLLPHERRIIEQVFKTNVTDRYGCEEVSLIGCECEKHDGMHMNIEHLVIEFIKEDGTSAAPGEAGQIVVTDLMNRALPFVRYRVEDIGVPLARTCSCGRGLPLMGNVAGRVADFLIKEDGTRVAGVSLIENTLTDISGIDQMQIIQYTIRSFKLNVVRGRGYGSLQADQLKRYFKEIFGSAIVIDLQEVAEIKAEKSGKYRFSICHL